MPPQPTVFWSEGVWELHGRGRDVDLVSFDQLARDALAVLDDGQVLKEILGAEIAFEAIMAVGGDDFPQPFPVQIGLGYGLAVIAVIASDVLS